MKNILLLNKEIIIDKCERVFYSAPGDDWQEHFMVMRGSWEKVGDRLSTWGKDVGKSTKKLFK